MTRSDELFFAIDRFLATPPYHACLLLIHHDIAKLQTISQRTLKQYGWVNVSIGTSLSKTLLSVATKSRSGQARRTFSELVRPHRPGPVLCTDIDLLFEPSLALDGLSLLREASRQINLIVMWPGAFEHDVLAYATADHAHYQTWNQTDLCDYCIVTL